MWASGSCSFSCFKVSVTDAANLSVGVIPDELAHTSLPPIRIVTSAGFCLIAETA